MAHLQIFSMFVLSLCFSFVLEMEASLYINNNTLHSEIKYVIRTAQMFGIFPVTNVLNLKYNTVCFKWLSPFTFYAIFSILGTLGLTILSFIRMCLSDFKLHLLGKSIVNKSIVLELMRV